MWLLFDSSGRLREEAKWRLMAGVELERVGQPFLKTSFVGVSGPSQRRIAALIAGRSGAEVGTGPVPAGVYASGPMEVARGWVLVLHLETAGASDAEKEGLEQQLLQASHLFVPAFDEPLHYSHLRQLIHTARFVGGLEPREATARTALELRYRVPRGTGKKLLLLELAEETELEREPLVEPLESRPAQLQSQHSQMGTKEQADRMVQDLARVFDGSCAVASPSRRLKETVLGLAEPSEDHGELLVRLCDLSTPPSAPPRISGHTFQIFVRLDRTFSLTVRGGQTIEEVKRKLLDKQGFPDEVLPQISFTWGGRLLKNEVTLDHCLIRSESTIHAHIRHPTPLSPPTPK